MRRINYIILIITALFIIAGCEDKFNTSHPKEGGIHLEVDWSKTANQSPPVVYQAHVIAASGATNDFDNLTGTNNLLIVNPGEVMLYVYNDAEHITVSGKNVKIAGNQNPGMFYSYASQVTTERDSEINHKATMTQQTGELNITLAIKPATMISKVKTITATLDGMYAELDMQTNALSASTTINAPLSIGSYYATTILRTLGFNPASKQNLQLEIELENGKSTSIISDLSSQLSGFNQSKNTLLSLSAELYIMNEQSPVATFDKWERNAEIKYLSVAPTEIELSNLASSVSIDVVTDQPAWDYSISTTGNWLTATQSADQLAISASENRNTEQREASIHFTAGGLSETVVITQEPTVVTTYSDKQTVKLQSATIGKGVDIILMGDGYTIKDMDRGTGKYERDMRTATEHFFSVYPYSDYRDYFNVYMIVAVSNQEGISVESPYKKVDTRFESIWEGGRSTGIDCNDDIVIEYLEAMDELENADMHDLTVIMPINANIYAGTCMLWYDPRRDYANGFSISMCPVGAYFNEVVIHEAGGHGFSKLIDEYIYNPNDCIPDKDKNTVNMYKRYGLFENVDFFSNISQTSWKGFSGLSAYSMVATFEGAYLYGKCIWRPEYNSCMNNNVPYYNAPSRWAQLRRIKRLAGFSYTFNQFLQDDKIPAYPTTTRRFDDKTFVPLGAPMFKESRVIRQARK